MNNTPLSSKIHIVIYRPHENIWFYPPLKHIIRGIKQPNKYRLLFDSFISSDLEISIAPTLILEPGFKGWIKFIKDRIDIILWCLLNRLDVRRIGFSFSINAVKSADYIFFIHYGTFTHEAKAVAERGFLLAKLFSFTPAKKIVHMTHYLYNVRQGSINLETLNPDICIAENNLKKNSTFFNKHFKKNTACFQTLPYVVAARFERKKPFFERLNKIVTTGSITYKIRDTDFIEYFNSDELQPLRRLLFEQAACYNSEMDCLISDLNASRENNMKDKVSFYLRITKKLSNIIHGYNPQKAYYKKNIVDIYNEYMMFAVPEEICDLPAIGFVEGMACGSAFFGLDDPMYRDLGLIPGIHYVSYDGTVIDLMNKVRYYQSHVDELELIANCGYEFVTQNFKPEVVYGNFIKMLVSRE